MPEQKIVKIHPLFNFVVQFLIIALVFFGIGYKAGQKKIEIERRGFVPKITISNQLPPTNQTLDFSLFWNVLETLPQKYLDKSAIDSQKLLYGAISGMVRSLGDPYTAFLDPKQNQAVKEDLAGSYEGVGIQIGFNKDKRLVVIAPLSGTPAKAAGIEAKDLILKINDKETFDLTLPEAVDLIRGPAGTKVKILFGREGTDKPFEKELERAKINVKSVELEFKSGERGDVAIIKVARFGDKTDAEWDAAVGEVVNRKTEKVIVDMRNNPGGLLSSSVHLASEFVGGTIVKQEGTAGRIDSLSSDHQGKLLDESLIVLVNKGSASAAEIFAGAIQDNRRGKIVGETTFGKGTVQDVVDFPGGSGLHVTIAKWLTPKGKSIHDVGISPDVIVPDQPSEGVIADKTLSKALELISQ